MPPADHDPWAEPEQESPRPFKASEKLSAAARRDRDRRETRIGWRMAAIGWEVSSQVVAGVALGWGADYFFPSLGHWGIIGGAVAGVLVGLGTFLRSALRLNRELEGPAKNHSDKGSKSG